VSASSRASSASKATGLVAGTVVSEAPGLRPGKTRQTVAGRGHRVSGRGAIEGLARAVAREVISEGQRACGRIGALGADQPVQAVEGEPQIETGIDSGEHRTDATGGVVSEIAAVGITVDRIGAQGDATGAPGQIVVAADGLAIAPGPAHDGAERLVRDIGEEQGAIDAQGADPAVGPRMGDDLAGRGGHADPLAGTVVGVGGDETDGADGLGPARHPAVDIVGEGSAARSVDDLAQPAEAVGAGIPDITDGLVAVTRRGEPVQGIVAIRRQLAAGVETGLEVAATRGQVCSLRSIARWPFRGKCSAARPRSLVGAARLSSQRFAPGGTRPTFGPRFRACGALAGRLRR